MAVLSEMERGGMAKRWGGYITNKHDKEQHSRRHVIVVPEIHLLQGDLWKGKGWCQACGLKSIWSPGYRGTDGGRHWYCFSGDAAVGIEPHTATYMML